MNALRLYLLGLIGGGSASVTELIELLTLATDAYAESIANVSILRGSNPVTDPVSGNQYFAYHADNLPSALSGKVALIKVTPANVVTVDKSAITTDAQDSHNFFSLMPDGDGDILLSGDMHGVPLQFDRLTGGSIDITAWDTPPIEAGATNEASVTYPMWAARLANGDVLFTYRDGGSGDGNLVLKKWIKASKTLVTVALIVNGNADGKSFYPHVPYWDEARQRLHCGGCWRDTTFLNTNHDQFHFWLESSDGWSTVTAKKADGTAQTLPITVANAAYAAIIATNTGLTNVGSITIGSDGHPRLWSFRDPGDGFSQLFALRYTGSAWVDSWIPDDNQLKNQLPFSYVGLTDTLNWTAFSSPRAICDGTGNRTIIPMRSDTQGNGVWCLICERADLTQWTWKLLDATNVGFWFAAEDYVQWRDNGVIDMMHQRCKFAQEATIGPQTLSRLRFRPQSAAYDYTAPTALFDPDTYTGCIAYVAPRIGGAKVVGTVNADREKCTALYDARDGSALFVQADLNDAPKYVWNHFASAPARAGVLAVAASFESMTCTDAATLAALTGVNVPLVICAVVQFTNVTTAQCFFGGGTSSDITRYFRIGITAAGLPTFERRVAGGAASQYTGSAGSLVAGTKYIFTAVFDGTNGYIRINGVQQGAAVALGFAGTFTPTHLTAFVRRRSTGNDLWFDGVMGAMPVYTTVPSAAGIAAIENGLAAEYGITF